MMSLLVLPISLAFVTFVWLRTNAFIDFGGWIFKYIKFTKVKEYLNLSPTFQSSIFYINWLYTVWPDRTVGKFILKLITCPLCLSFWGSLLISDIRFFLFNSFVSLVAFCALDKVYKHGK